MPPHPSHSFDKSIIHNTETGERWQALVNGYIYRRHRFLFSFHVWQREFAWLTTDGVLRTTKPKLETTDPHRLPVSHCFDLRSPAVGLKLVYGESTKLQGQKKLVIHYHHSPTACFQLKIVGEDLCKSWLSAIAYAIAGQTAPRQMSQQKRSGTERHKQSPRIKHKTVKHQRLTSTDQEPHQIPFGAVADLTTQSVLNCVCHPPNKQIKPKKLKEKEKHVKTESPKDTTTKQIAEDEIKVDKAVASSSKTTQKMHEHKQQEEACEPTPAASTSDSYVTVTESCSVAKMESSPKPELVLNPLPAPRLTAAEVDSSARLRQAVRKTRLDGTTVRYEQQQQQEVQTKKTHKEKPSPKYGTVSRAKHLLFPSTMKHQKLTTIKDTEKEGPETSRRETSVDQEKAKNIDEDSDNGIWIGPKTETKQTPKRVSLPAWFRHVSSPKLSKTNLHDSNTDKEKQQKPAPFTTSIAPPFVYSPTLTPAPKPTAKSLFDRTDSVDHSPPSYSPKATPAITNTTTVSSLKPPTGAGASPRQKSKMFGSPAFARDLQLSWESRNERFQNLTKTKQDVHANAVAAHTDERQVVPVNSASDAPQIPAKPKQLIHKRSEPKLLSKTKSTQSLGKRRAMFTKLRARFSTTHVNNATQEQAGNSKQLQSDQVGKETAQRDDDKRDVPPTKVIVDDNNDKASNSNKDNNNNNTYSNNNNTNNNNNNTDNNNNNNTDATSTQTTHHHERVYVYRRRGMFSSVSPPPPTAQPITQQPLSSDVSIREIEW